jgi:AcrR family transcriptional regulator
MVGDCRCTPQGLRHGTTGLNGRVGPRGQRLLPEVLDYLSAEWLTTGMPHHSETGVEPLADTVSRGRALRDSDGRLHPTAQRILDGARAVLVWRGFGALTLQATADAADVNKALITYHFGSKRGLIDALVDSIVREESVTLSALLESVPASERLAQFVTSVESLSGARESFRVFFDLLPHALRDSELHERMARLYEWYVDVKLEWLGLDPRRHPDKARQIVGLGELMVAVVDGLAVQRQVRGDDFDVSRALEVLDMLLSGSWAQFAPLHRVPEDLRPIRRARNAGGSDSI